MNALFTNPMIAGAIGIMLSGAVLYALKSVPMKLASLLWRRITSTLSVTGENIAFDWIEEWMHRQPFSGAARRVKMSRIWNMSEAQIATPTLSAVAEQAIEALAGKYGDGSGGR